MHFVLLDGIILNGEVPSVKSHEEGNESVSNEEVMEVDETQDSDEIDTEAASIEIDDEDSNESNIGDKGNIDINDCAEDEIHCVDNSDDDEVDEIVDTDKPQQISTFNEVTKILKDSNGIENDDEELIGNDCSLQKTSKPPQDSIVLNDSGDGDVEIIESSFLEQNDKCFNLMSNEPHKIEDEDDDDDVITLDAPVKKVKKQNIPIVDVPRRSARNLNKSSRKSYIEKVKEESTEEESDIEEVLPQDPLAVADPLTIFEKTSCIKKQSSQISSSTIVVKDTKRLVEIASKSTPNNSGKKEPTLVIIDTNSILSGRGPIPINQKQVISQPFPVLPMALPAQGVYPANMRATITPIPPINSSVLSATSNTHSPLQKSSSLQSSPSMQFSQLQSSNTSTPVTSQNNQQSPTLILPSLTDDMFVVEAPSFIVPYVYEKPPVKDLKEFVTKFAKELKERRIAEEKEKLIAEEKEKQIAVEKEREKELIDKDNETNKEKEKTHECVDGEISSTEITNEDSEQNQKDIENDIKDEKEEKAKYDEANEVSDKFENDDLKIIENTQEESKTENKKDSFNVLDSEETTSSNKPYSYFESPLGKFFVDIGHNLVQEFVQTDLLKQQKRKREREGGKNVETNKTITSLIKNLEYTKENNEPYHMPIKKCEFCSFKTESALAMAFHLETPHMKNFVYRCNFCSYEIRSPHDILFHMEAEHMIRGRLERAPAFHQCPNCPFEDNQKGKLSRHLVACSRKFKPERNLEPPLDWEPPAKIPRVPRMKQSNLTSTAAMYQAMAKSTQYQLMQKMQSVQSAFNRGRGRPSLGTVKHPSVMRTPTQNMIYKSSMSGGSVLLPTNYQLSGNQLYQVRNK